MPIVMPSAGSSIAISGSGLGSSGSAIVSPIVISGMPAIATISPGPGLLGVHALHALGEVELARRGRSRPCRRGGTRRPARPCLSVPLWTRQSARRPTYGDASRFVTSAWRPWPSSYSGAGTCSSRMSNSGRRSVPSLPSSAGRPAGLRVRVDDRELDLLLVGVEVEEQVVHLVHDLVDARVRAVDLVHHEDHRQAPLERLAEHEAGLRQRALGRVHEQQHAVDHREAALDLAPEVGVAGRVDDVQLRAAVVHGGVLGEDRDARARAPGPSSPWPGPARPRARCRRRTGAAWRPQEWSCRGRRGR